MKKILFGGADIKSGAANIGLFILRVFTGLTMAIAHGWGKTPPSEKFIEGVAKMGFPMPEVFAWAASLSELVGGILLAIGLSTRPAAFFIACTMGVAGFVRHASDPFATAEKAFLFLAIAIAFVFIGGGKYALDRRYA